jgi:hypothetical protein
MLSFNKNVICVYTDKKYKEDTVCGSSDIDIGVVIKDNASAEDTADLMAFLDGFRRMSIVAMYFVIWKAAELKNSLEMSVNPKYQHSIPVIPAKMRLALKPARQDSERNNWIFCFFNSFTDMYYTANEIRTPSIVRHFCNNFIKLSKKLTPGVHETANYAFCKMLLGGEDKRPVDIRNACRLYVQIANGANMRFDAAMMEKFTNMHLGAVLQIEERVNTDRACAIHAGLSMRLTDARYPQKNKAAILEQLRPSIADFCDKQNGTVRSVLLASAPCTDFGYFLYFILDDRAPDTACLKAISDSAGFPPHPLFGAITKHRICFISDRPNFIRSSGLSYLNTFHNPYCLPVEYYYLKRHGEIVCGDDMMDLLREPTASALFENIMAFSSRLPSTVRNAFMGDQLYVQRIISLLYCTLPATQLFLDHGMITTTPRETVAEYIRHYGKDASWIEKTYENYVDNPEPRRIEITAPLLKEWRAISEDILESIDLKVAELLRKAK